MMDQRKILGDYGEELASEYLKKKGYRLVGKKVKLFCGEIDLLFLDKGTLVITEVKTKSDDSFGSASEMITPRKRQKLLQLARALWQKYPQKTVRIDVVTIDEGKIKHLPSAVQEG